MGRDINRMTEMVRVVLGESDVAEPSFRSEAYRLRVRWKLARTITFDQMKEILLSKWTSTTGIDTMDVIHSLENRGVLRQSNKDIWKILLKREIPQSSSTPPWRIPKPQKPELKTKPGICPKCGKKVEYANRHQRAGSAHTGDECRLNQISDVMNE